MFIQYFYLSINDPRSAHELFYIRLIRNKKKIIKFSHSSLNFKWFGFELSHVSRASTTTAHCITAISSVLQTKVLVRWCGIVSGGVGVQLWWHGLWWCWGSMEATPLVQSSSPQPLPFSALPSHDIDPSLPPTTLPWKILLHDCNQFHTVGEQSSPTAMHCKTTTLPLVVVLIVVTLSIIEKRDKS